MRYPENAKSFFINAIRRIKENDSNFFNRMTRSGHTIVDCLSLRPDLSICNLYLLLLGKELPKTMQQKVNLSIKCYVIAKYVNNPNLDITYRELKQVAKPIKIGKYLTIMKSLNNPKIESEVKNLYKTRKNAEKKEPETYGEKIQKMTNEKLIKEIGKEKEKVNILRKELQTRTGANQSFDFISESNEELKNRFLISAKIPLAESRSIQ